MLTLLLETLRGWPAPIVLVVAAVVLTAESGTLAGVALPGTTLLVALGLWSHAAPGVLVPAIAVSAAATVTGAHHSWWRGRSGRGVVHARAAQARRWLAGRGSPATTALVCCGHWASAARPLLPRIAGGAGVPYRIVGPALLLSGTAWAATLVLLGNQIGEHVLALAGWAPIVLVVVLIGALTLLARRSAAARAGRSSFTRST